MSFHFAARNPVSKWRWDTLLTKEPATIAWIDEMPEGSILWDIGANIGIYSIYAADRGLEVVAVEPVHKHFAELCENVALNGLGERVTPVCMLVGNCYGSDTFNGQSSLLAPLDSLNYALGHPTHIKIDTDGSDLDVLRGSCRVLMMAQSVIVEVDETRDDAPHIRDLMSAAGFTRTGRHICPLTPQSPIGMDHWRRL
jgi:hypothetical protein